MGLVIVTCFPKKKERSSFKLGQTSPGPALREGMGQGNGTGPGQDELPTKPPAELAPLTDAERAAPAFSFFSFLLFSSSSSFFFFSFSFLFFSFSFSFSFLSCTGGA